ncbi:MAG: CHAT domain-containing protein [Desulfobacula sp.]|mgnify:CR=1 FL=1|uniref:CHAT domain-containing protein n=1 Tax=Desulfobacula sp. TaxID=2593537 RepID=UPI002A00F99C|nr:CHAT domain-containing protein [Desulfobacula sp.]
MKDRIFLIIMAILIMTESPALAGMTSNTEPGQNRSTISTQILSIEKNAMDDYAYGKFANAAKLWEQAALLYKKTMQRPGHIKALIHLSEALLETGNVNMAKNHLDTAVDIAGSINDLELLFKARATLGKLLYQTGDLDQAEIILKKCLDQLKDLNKKELEATVFLNYSNILFAKKKFRQAAGYYRQSMEKAQEQNQFSLAVKAAVNLAKTQVVLKNYTILYPLLKQTFSQAANLTDSFDKAISLISIGRIVSQQWADHKLSPLAGELLFLAYDTFEAGCQVAQRINNNWSYSYGLGSLGQLYQKNGQLEEAVYYTRQAIFKAQQIGAFDILYQWQWDMGRQFKLQGKIDNAIEAYGHALKSISEIREDLKNDCKGKSKVSFREAIGPVYFELADLLLQRSAQKNDPERLQIDLTTAQNTVEQLKQLELQDYFQDDCLIALKARQSSLDKELPGTAVIYPVLLPERMEIIVTIGGVKKSFNVDVPKTILTKEVRWLRKKLEQPGSRFIRHSRKLYKWIIQPVEKELEKHDIHTLIFVPDGPLRTIPMSCLHDGDVFLIKKFAIATTPSLTLTDLVPLRRQGIKLLLNGLTESVQNFSPLPYVDMELSEINKMYMGRLLMNEAFVYPSVKQELENTSYSIIHIASHGQFDKDPEKTFVLTHNGKLTLDSLEELMALSNFRQEPVELLSLSACQTAVGDDRAALGLAGIAVKSGARSALASLWFINDKAASMLLVDFYKRLLDSDTITKAQALQKAQINLLEQDAYQHPTYWAPFLLIGNWL